MDIKNAIENRRAIKQFDANHTVSQDEINDLFTQALKAPSSFNIQHWRFVLVQDPELRKEIRTVAWDQPQITDSSVLAILTVDVKAWEKDPANYWTHAPQAAQDFLVPAIAQFYEGRDQMQRDEAMRSAGLVAQTLMLAAQGMGLDTCPMVGFDFDKVGQMINLPADHEIAMMVAIGKRSAEPHPRGSLLSLDKILVKNTF